jgi:hypothetical protein
MQPSQTRENHGKHRQAAVLQLTGYTINALLLAFWQLGVSGI